MKNITLSRDTVTQWLEDLEYSDSDKNVIAAIKQALAAPVPDAITDNSESVEYRSGWNECRELMLRGQP